MTQMYSGLHLSQRFSSLEEFKTVIRSISVRQHWELRVIRSNKRSVVIGCRSATTCFFRVVCRSNKNATYITSLQDSHSCQRSVNSPNRTPSRSEASHVRFLLNEIPKLFDMNSKIKGQDVVDAVKRYHGYDISMRQAQRALIKLQPHDDGTQGDSAMGLDLTAGEQHSPSQSQPESQGEAGPAYRDLSESRWMTDPLGSSLIDEETVNLNESSSSHAAVAPAPPAAQPVRPPPILQPPSIGPPAQTALGSDPRTMTVSQPGVGYPTAESLPATGPEHPKPPQYAPRADTHGIPQMVLTNFKIEFTCTTCGSLNQSLFPNQGNVTGAGYMGHPPVPDQDVVPRHPGPSDGPGHGGDVGEDESYAVNALNARAMQNAWAGGLGVPIGPSNT